jgi:hypothetical protein
MSSIRPLAVPSVSVIRSASEVSFRAAAQSPLNGAWTKASNLSLTSSPSIVVITWPGNEKYSSGRLA